ncbi:MAG: Tar ligand binding domain-containing protein, partial [Planctomycetaceae bacterium]
MMPRSIPVRIALLCGTLVLFSVVTGALGMWWLTRLDAEVTRVAENSVPSLKVLNEATNALAAAGRAVRRMALAAAPAERDTAERAYQAARAEVAAAFVEYEKYFSDEEDERLFRIATERREAFFRA